MCTVKYRWNLGLADGSVYDKLRETDAKIPPTQEGPMEYTLRSYASHTEGSNLESIARERLRDALDYEGKNAVGKHFDQYGDANHVHQIIGGKKPKSYFFGHGFYAFDEKSAHVRWDSCQSLEIGEIKCESLEASPEEIKQRLNDQTVSDYRYNFGARRLAGLKTTAP